MTKDLRDKFEEARRLNQTLYISIASGTKVACKIIAIYDDHLDVNVEAHAPFMMSFDAQLMISTISFFSTIDYR